MGSDQQHKKTSAATFVITVMHEENATWQGSIRWIDKQMMKNFRSALELMKLIDSALETKNG